MKRLGYRVKLSGPAGHIEAMLSFVNPTTREQKAFFLFPLDRNVTPVKILGKAGNRKIEAEAGPPPTEEGGGPTEARLPAELCKLFQEETENVLAIPLGEIPPGGEVAFQILMAHMVYDTGESGNGFSFRLPLMTSQSLTTLNREHDGQLVLATGLDRGAQVAISVQIEASDLEPGSLQTSQVCGVARNPQGDIAVEYDKRKPLEPRDFVLDYHLWAGNRPKAWMRSTGRHFLLNFLPPANPTPSHPRRLVILVDGSEEMNKVAGERCTGCLSYILKNLAPEDKFALVAFNREVSGYKNGDFVEASCADEAIDWMSRYQFGGAADLKELLRRVVTLPRQPESVLSVLLLTAGRIGNEPELYRLIHGSRDILRLFPILLGFRADPQFARAAARLTGGYAFRALTPESVSRVAERVLEHTRQPVLEGVALHDKGIQYQGDTLTPKYPTGLNWRRPITVLGAHTGRGGIEAGGSGPGGATWSEFLELKPAFHKLLSHVWAHVKSSELDDEAQMLDRAERNILQNVIRNLSREFRLLNRYTAAYVKTNDQLMLAPNINAGAWYRRIEKEEAASQSANELLEKQRSGPELKSGLSKQRNPGRGLTMKEGIGSKSPSMFGSKISTKSKLGPSMKENFISKPMLSSRHGSSSGSAVASRGTATAVRSNSYSNHTPPPTPPEPKPPAPPSAPPEPVFDPPSFEPLPPPTPPEPEPLPPEPIPDPVEPQRSSFQPSPVVHDAPTLTQMPGTGFGPPSIAQTPAVDDVGMGLDADDLEVDEFGIEPPAPAEPRPVQPTVLRRDGGDDGGPRLPRINMPAEPVVEDDEPEPAGGSFSLPIPRGEDEETKGTTSNISFDSDEDEQAVAPPSIPSIPDPVPEPEPPAPPIPDPVPAAPTPPPAPVQAEPKLLTPRELAAKILPEARQGNPEDVARNALKSEPEIRKQLMMEMRTLHGKLASGNAAVLAPMTDSILMLLARVGPKSELLIRAYGLGFQARGLIQKDLNEAKNKLKFWLTRFAKLF